MSGLEIERKFIVSKAKAFKSLAFAHQTIKQGYIPCQDATVRIRTKGDKSFLTIKSRSVDGGLSRYEFEKGITHEEAENLFKLCKGGMIEKERFFIKSGEHTFEVDEFYGDNEGLIMAEVELSSIDEPFIKPDFIEKEVTGDKRFYNSFLLHFPYKLWKDKWAEEQLQSKEP